MKRTIDYKESMGLTGLLWQMPKVICGAVLAWAVFQTGCATVNPKQDYVRARELIQHSTGFERTYDPEEVELSEDELNAALADGLALDEAVQLALLNNRKLQVSFLDIGIARADLVQSGLFLNPSLGVGILFPSGGGRSNIQANIAQNIVQLWQMPVKKRSAEHALEQKIVSVARLAGHWDSHNTWINFWGAGHCYHGEHGLLIALRTHVARFTFALGATPPTTRADPPWRTLVKPAVRKLRRLFPSQPPVTLPARASGPDADRRHP